MNGRCHETNPLPGPGAAWHWACKTCGLVAVAPDGYASVADTWPDRASHGDTLVAGLLPRIT